MGQFVGSIFVVVGTHSSTWRWGDYSACAVTLNSVTRGGIWCAGEYAGPGAQSGTRASTTSAQSNTTL